MLRATRFTTDSKGATADAVEEFHKRLHALRVEWMAARAAVAPITFGEYLIALHIHNEEKKNG
jgi:hypothetical protein